MKNLNTINLSDAFRAALKELLSFMPRGSQSRLAEDIGMSRQYLTHMLTGRAKIPDDDKSKIADWFGVSALELVIAGYRLLNTGEWFPYAAKVIELPPGSVYRAAEIYSLVAMELEESKIFASLFRPESIDKMGLPGVEDYLSRKLKDTELCTAAGAHITSMIEKK